METLHLNLFRTLTNSDFKQNIPFAVQVPENTRQLKIRLSFSPWYVDGRRNMLTMSVFDPDGFRGAGHRQGTRHEVVINAHFATPGYRPGPIPAGDWSVVVDTHMIMPGVPVPLEIEVIGTDEQGEGSPIAASVHKTASRGRGWYRGDLHAHTNHSDASWDLNGLLDWARRYELDFCTLTDHNTVSGLPGMDASSTEELLTMSGWELTTFWGHALVLGLREWMDWRMRPTEPAGSERSMNRIAERVTARGGLFVIAHPRSVGDPGCTGCRWLFDSMMPGNATVVEIWNEYWQAADASNEDSLELAYEWLNQGRRMALTSGTDIHGPPDGNPEPYAYDVVYAEDLSEREILNAVRKGHLYMSTGPALELTAAVNGARAMMGDALNAPEGAPVRVAATWADCPAGTQLALVVDGTPRECGAVEERGARDWELAGGKDHWCLVTLRGENGTMLALSNPIFFDGRGEE